MRKRHKSENVIEPLYYMMLEYNSTMESQREVNDF